MIPPVDTWQFENSWIGQRVLVFETLASTNTTAAELSALPEKSDGLVVLAHFQTSGRGQYGRVWQSQLGASLLMSVILDPPQELRRPAILTAAAGIAVAEAIEVLSGAHAQLKWPNDILIGGKKVCGILIEQHRSAIVGIGLNLNQSAEEFAEAGLLEATSLRILSGRRIELRLAVEQVLRQLDRIYSQLLARERSRVEAEWSRRLGLLGRVVSIELMDGSMLFGRLQLMSFDRLVLEIEGSLRALLPESIRHVVSL